MAFYTYLEIIGNFYTSVQVVCSGNPNVYIDLLWVAGDPIPSQAQLDADKIANPIPSDDDILMKTNSVTGSIMTASFTDHGTNVKNKWLGASENGVFSNSTPYVIPWDCNLIGLTISNKRVGAAVDLEIYRSAPGTGTTNTNILTWVLDNIRVARKTDISIALAAGDKLGVYVKRTGAGGGVDTPRVTLIFQITDGRGSESIENFTGNF